MSLGSRARIADYGTIGNCRTAALVSRFGSIDWCCFPKFDSPSIFGRLLDREAGHFSISPAARFRSWQGYIQGTNVLQTHFRCESGRAVLKDCFTVKDSKEESDELLPDEEILRVLEVEEGECIFDFQFSPKGHYGRARLERRLLGNWGIQCQHGRKQLLLQSSQPIGTFKLLKGERAVFSLTYSDSAPSVIPPLLHYGRRLAQTLRYWRNWSEQCEAKGPYALLVQRSALTLKLLNYAPSGAFVAAPTTSLPEWIGGPRNWDYRFCWLRDASFTTRALMRLGYWDEARSFLNWLVHSTRLTQPELGVLYSVYGEHGIKECEASWLEGYRGSSPVRLGNAASSQRQLDVYGEVVDSLFVLSEHLSHIDRETRRMVISFGSAVARFWREPDQGIWELRKGPLHCTHSKLMCWVAMDRLAKLSKRLQWKLPYDAETIAGEIRAEIELRGVDPVRGVYTQSFGERELDANLLVMPQVGYCAPDDPRFVRTRDEITRGLSKNGLLYRYRLGSDGMDAPEGAFTICNFWLATALAMNGQVDEAMRWFDAVVRRIPPTGLSAEELDPESGEYLGNFPQGFSHIGLVHAALEIAEAKERMAA